MYQEQNTEWLLDCLGAGAADEKAARLSRLLESDWSQVIDVAVRHKVAPLLYDRLKSLSSNGQVPPAVLLRLRGIYLANAATNMKTYHDLGEVLAAFRAENISVIVLKGAHLAELVYGNIALRTMYDLDLLVKQDDLARAAAKLRELGYAWEDRQGVEAFYASTQHLPPFVRPGAAIIEIHRAVAAPLLGLNIESDGLWERSRAVTVAGVETRVLSPEDLLLHLCVHTTYHHSYTIHGIRPFCDIAQTLQHHLAEMEWRQVQVRAQQWGVGKGVHLTLLLLRGLLGAPVPGQVLASLRPKDFNGKWEALARKQIHLMGDAGAQERAVSWKQDYGSLKMARLLGPSPLLAKFRILSKSLFPSPRKIHGRYRVPLRSPRLYFCYLLWLCSLVRQYLPIAWRFVRGGKKRMLHDVSEVWQQTELPEFYDWLKK